MTGAIRTKSYRVDRKAYLQAFVRRGIVRLIVFIVSVYFGMALMMGPAKAVEPTQLISLGLTTLVVVALWYATLWQRLNRPDFAKFFDLSRYLEISNEAVVARMEDGAEYRSPWNHYAHSVRHGEMTLVYRHDRNLVVVPDSVFDSKQDLAEFQDLLREKGLLKRKA